MWTRMIANLLIYWRRHIIMMKLKLSIIQILHYNKVINLPVTEQLEISKSETGFKINILAPNEKVPVSKSNSESRLRQIKVSILVLVTKNL